MAKVPIQNTRPQPRRPTKEPATALAKLPIHASCRETQPTLTEQEKDDRPTASSPLVARHYAALARWVDALQAKGRYTFTTHMWQSSVSV